MHLDGKSFAEGELFHFDLHLFDTGSSAVRCFVMAFAELASDGLGRGRRRVELSAVSRLNTRGEAAGIVYAADSQMMEGESAALLFDLNAVEEASHARVRFLTPTELKCGSELIARPELAVLAARARDRISALREFYGDGPLAIDFRGFGERAGLVKMTRCEIDRVNVRRRSSRTGQVHPMGGFVGEAEYEGDIGEFVPYLKVAQWTGVGRQTVWGKGAIEVETK